MGVSASSQKKAFEAFLGIHFKLLDVVKLHGFVCHHHVSSLTDHFNLSDSARVYS